MFVCRTRNLIFLLVIILHVLPALGVGQVGNIGNLGKKNAGLAQNTLAARKRYLKRFQGYLEIKKMSLGDFFKMDKFRQGKVLGVYFDCFRKKKSYQMDGEKVWLGEFLEVSKKAKRNEKYFEVFKFEKGFFLKNLLVHLEFLKNRKL